MIKALFTALRPSHSITTLLARADDHLLDDIGLTRWDVETLLSARTASAPKLRLTAAHA